MSIMEFLDLESLSEGAREMGWWTVFVTVKPLNVWKRVASPANAMAVF